MPAPLPTLARALSAGLALAWPASAAELSHTPAPADFGLTAEVLKTFGCEDTPLGLSCASDDGQNRLYAGDERVGVLKDLARRYAEGSGTRTVRRPWSPQSLESLSKLSAGRTPDEAYFKKFYDNETTPVALQATSSLPADDSPLSAMERIYRAADADRLMQTFQAQYELLRRDPELYKKVLQEVVEKNDNVNVAGLSAQPALSEADRARLAIRMLARCILRMGDIDQDGAHLLEMSQRVAELPENSWYNSYFDNELYSALAKNCPERLLAMAKEQPASGFRPAPHAAVLALLRSGYPVDQAVIKAAFERADLDGGMPLLYYLGDPDYKLAALDHGLTETADRPYLRRQWKEREIINALASFPEGRQRLRELQESGRIRYLRVSGVYFGTLSRSLTVKELRRYLPTFRQASRYILKSNRRFGGPERVLYVDITPDEADGQRLNSAGWGNESLYLTRGCLMNNSPRATAFSLAHEACEQRSTHGYLTAELGLSYLEASRDGAMEDLRLGRRIGGKYVDTGLGHPGDSEREWLAESASAAVIGEEVPLRARAALRAVEGTFRRP